MQPSKTRSILFVVLDDLDKASVPLILNSEDLVVMQNRTYMVHNVISTIELGREEDLPKLFIMK